MRMFAPSLMVLALVVLLGVARPDTAARYFVPLVMALSVPVAAVTVLTNGWPLTRKLSGRPAEVREPAAVVIGAPVEVGPVEGSRPSTARVAAVAAGAAGLHVGRHMTVAMARSGLVAAKITGKIGFALLRASLKK